MTYSEPSSSMGDLYIKSNQKYQLWNSNIFCIVCNCLVFVKNPQICTFCRYVIYHCFMLYNHFLWIVHNSLATISYKRWAYMMMMASPFFYSGCKLIRIYLFLYHTLFLLLCKTRNKAFYVMASDGFYSSIYITIYSPS